MQSRILKDVLVRNIDKTFKELIIQLPTKDGEIDFEYMETLISAIQKLVIKDVVLYADKKIEATKKIVSFLSNNPSSL